MALLHAILVIYLLVSGWIAFGAWFRESAAVAYERRNKRRHMPWMWPKELKTYVLMYRLIATLALAASIAVYAYFLVLYY